MDQMIELNEYLYTTFSQIPWDDGCSMSVEGSLPLSIANRLVDVIRGKKLWFVLYNDKGVELDKFIDLSLIKNGCFVLVRQPYTKTMRLAKNMEQFNEGDGWMKDDDGYYKFNKSRYLLVSNGKECTTSYTEEGMETRDYAKQLIEAEDPLVSIFIEDPDETRDTLLSELINIFKSRGIPPVTHIC